MRATAAFLLFLLWAAPVFAKPNIVVILTDDQEVSSMAYMPKLQSLLTAHGMTFSNSFVNFSMCCPSRVSFFTGQASHNTGITSNTARFGGGWTVFRDRESDTLPVWLKAAGYRTALIGKYLNEYGSNADRQAHRPKAGGLLQKTAFSWSDLFNKYLDGKRRGAAAEPRAPVPPGWDTWFALTKIDYFDEKFSDDGNIVSFDSRPQDYSTDVIRDHAVRYIGDQAGSDQPFFLLVATNAPHLTRRRVAATPAPRHADLFADIELPKTPAFNRTMSGQPSWLQRRRPLTAAGESNLTDEYRAEMQSLQSVDELTEAVVDALQKAGRLDNTFIIYTSDNGFLFGDHRIESKGVVYENSIRVPLIIRGPGIAGNTTSPALVNNLDVGATIEELAGAKPGLAPDGRSLVPLFTDPNAAWRSALLVEGLYRPGQLITAVRTADKKYIRNQDGFEELYDLAADPYELNNLASAPDSAASLASLRALSAKLASCAGPTCWVE